MCVSAEKSVTELDFLTLWEGFKADDEKKTFFLHLKFVVQDFLDDLFHRMRVWKAEAKEFLRKTDHINCLKYLFPEKKKYMEETLFCIYLFTCGPNLIQ